MDSLFRKEAIEHQSRRLYGSIILYPPLISPLLTALISVCVALSLFWLMRGTYARYETVVGWVEPEAGIIKIYPQEYGVVEKIFVKEGEIVKKNSPLIEVRSNKALGNGEEFSAEIQKRFSAQRDNLTDEIARQSTISQQSKLDFLSQLSAEENALTIANQKTSTLSMRHELAVKQVSRLSDLGKLGHSSPSELDAALTQELLIKSSMEDLEQEKLNISKSIHALKSALQTQPDVDKTKINQIASRIADLDQQSIKARMDDSHLLRSPCDGTVYNLQAFIGQNLNQLSFPLMTITPERTNFVVHLLVPVKAAGFVRIGQPINIRFDAFPYQRYGIYRGEVADISPAVLIPGEVYGAPLKVNEPVYRVTANLEMNFIKAYGKQIDLKPGMTLSVDINLGERSFFKWLLDPVFSLNGRV